MLDWQEILNRNGPGVWRTVYRLLGNRADADECFQEVFLAALGVSRREPVRHWPALLQRLATTRAVDHLRRQRRRAPTVAVPDWEAVCGPAPPSSQGAEQAELAEQLRQALARLALKQAEVFCLHCLEGWSYQDIALHMVISLDAVGVLLHRARQQLRTLLADLLPAAPVPTPANKGNQANPRKEPK